jgi:hypothetical protein
MTARFKKDAGGALACMNEFGLTEAQQAAVFAAGLSDPSQKVPERMRGAADMPTMRALTDLIAAELASQGEFKSHW